MLAASSLYQPIKKLEEVDQKLIADLVHTFPSLDLEPNTPSRCCCYLTSTLLKNRKKIRWHSLLRRSKISHAKLLNISERTDKLLGTLKIIHNLFHLLRRVACFTSPQTDLSALTIDKFFPPVYSFKV